MAGIVSANLLVRILVLLKTRHSVVLVVFKSVDFKSCYVGVMEDRSDSSSVVLVAWPWLKIERFVTDNPLYSEV
ncbi:hypothetical protein TNCV_3639601 [Trichonephila clavipes]|nr:hypothetical protein TNCV_3639601 [Trichonephila clavipes]